MKQKVNLLLVDDISSNLMALSAILDRPSYNLVTASSGAEALDLLAREEFALVLLDVMMPGMDGFEVATRMKQDVCTRYIPIIFVTALAKDLKEIYQGYKAGAVDYIQKPLEAEIVRAKVAVFIELFLQRAEIERQSELIQNSERAQFLEREQAARLRAEDAERRFRNLVNALDHAIIWEATVDLGHFTFISERVDALLGYPHDQWLKEPHFFLNHVNPEDRPFVLENAKKVLDGRDDGLGTRCEHRFFTADGGERWFHTGLQEERDKEGNPVRLRGLCVDITPLKNVEKALRQAVQARDEIVSVVAHDLKNPLAAANLGAQLLMKSAEEEDINSVKFQAGRIKTAIGRTLKLAEDILDVEKADSGRVVSEFHEEEATEMVKAVVEILSPLAAEKYIRIQTDLRSCPVKCDCSRIRQVLSNLIGNAIKFTPENGRILVRVGQKNGDALFSVLDTGCGIAEDDISHIFERFWQGREMRGQGSGLGLAISKGIIEAHGGQVWVESVIGQGSTFFFTIPISGSMVTHSNSAWVGGRG